MHKKKVKPLFRLTLKPDAVRALQVAKKQPFKAVALGARPGGAWDVGISISVADQLMTAALPKENLSDTVLRIIAHQNLN